MLLDAPAKLRSLLGAPGLVWGPAVYDGVSASLADATGFPAIFVSGAYSAASRTGLPDLGLATASEQVESARMVQSIVGVPVIADADNGFGSVLNVVRTVHMYEQAGVAGIHIEDQPFPKRCGHLEGKTVMDRDEFTQRIRAAVSERWNPDFVIIARTDSRAPLGFAEAMRRIHDAFDAGADIGFVEAPQSMRELEQIIEEAPGPMMLNMPHRGLMPSLTALEIEALGFKLAVWAGACMRVATTAMATSLEALRRDGTDRGQDPMSPREFFNLLGQEALLDINHRYVTTGAEPLS